MLPEGLQVLRYLTILGLLLTAISGSVRLLSRKASWSEGVNAILSVIGLIWISWI